MSLTKFSFILTIAALALAMVGCYEDPLFKNAEYLLPAEKRIYLKNAGLAHLTVKSIYEKGLIYDSFWTNLSSRVVSVEDFSFNTIDYLNLDGNSLTNVDEIAKFTSLKWLRLNLNQLSSLPDLSSLTDLRRIYLRGNRFASVPETLKALPLLTDIDLSENRQLAEVPKWLAEKSGLEHLSLSTTSITCLPDDISAWKSLKTLQLGNLHLSKKEMDRIRLALPKTAVVF